MLKASPQRSETDRCHLSLLLFGTVGKVLDISIREVNKIKCMRSLEIKK